jgi:hypothetical protein
MGMLFDLRRITRDEADALSRNPDDIHFFLYGEESEEPRKGLLKRLFGPRAEPRQARAWQEPPEDRMLSLDKSWHVIHYLFARSADEGPLPQATLLTGGRELGSVDVGYGPARLLNPQEVDAFARFLDSLSQETYAAGVSGSELEENEIYGGYADWGPEDSAATWAYVEDLKSFFASARDAGDSILMYIY